MAEIVMKVAYLIFLCAIAYIAGATVAVWFGAD